MPGGLCISMKTGDGEPVASNTTCHASPTSIVAEISGAIVVFEREVARSMICHSLVNFSLKEDELRSAPIHAGEFASFCQLKPGRYKYKIFREAMPASGSDAARRLEGEIIVGNPRGQELLRPGP